MKESFLGPATRIEIAAQLNLLPCEKGFLDPEEGIPVSDKSALEMMLRKFADVPISANQHNARIAEVTARK